ncbi:MAG: DNA repair protein RecN [Candidatus Zixiibacteriota bacterium]
MLTRLTIENYALVEHVDIDFRPGLTVLTGETGSGKSVIIGGLILALGGRADKELIRHGSDKSIVKAEFQTTKKGDSHILGREVSAAGTSRAYIDDQASTIAALNEAAAPLCDLNTQQGQRNLLDIDKHITFVDSFAGLNQDVDSLRELYAEFIDRQKQLNDARTNADALRERMELINFQIDELTKADITVGEEKQLNDEQKKLESVRTLMETAQEIVFALSENDDSIISSLSQLKSRLRHAAELDKDLKADSDLLAESVINLTELTRNIESYSSRLEDNPQRLEEINERLNELYRLKKKYNTDEAGLVAKLEALTRESLGTDNIDEMIKKLAAKLAAARDGYHKAALKISESRHKAAALLEKQLIKELADLAIEKASFKIDFQYEQDNNGFDLNGETVKAYPHGLEMIEFFISTNPNEPLRPLVKIASGGEISRIMLGLLTVIAGRYKYPTIVFDEIDTGIGGETAVRLAAKLKQLAKRHQIITISHLAAVASQADNHLVVTKQTKNRRNVIAVEYITGPRIKTELARMTATV